MFAVAASLFCVGAPARADFVFGDVSKVLAFEQTGPDTLTPVAGGANATFTAAFFDNLGIPIGPGPNAFDQVVMSYPGAGSPITLTNLSPGTHIYQAVHLAPSALDAAFPDGTYTLTATNSVTLASKAVTLDYRGDKLPGVAPQLSAASWNALQNVDPSQGVTLNFNGFTPDPAAVSATNFISLLDLTQYRGVPLGSTPFTFLAPSATSLVIPAGLLTSGHSYALSMAYEDQLTNTLDFSTLTDKAVLNNMGTYFDFTVGTVPVGGAPDNPFLPSSLTGGSLTFDNPTSGHWYDPPMTQGFEFSLSSGDFTEVGAPPVTSGFGPLEVVVDGQVVDVLNPGATYLFGSGVTDFRLRDISPGVDPSNPTAFPVYLTFSGAPTSLTMGAVPEPSSWMLALLGVAGCGAALRRRSRATARAATCA
jgi:hypothetical protein